MIRCDECDALNPEGAAWCGQCYQRFDRSAKEKERDGEPAPARDGEPPLARDGEPALARDGEPAPARDGEPTPDRDEAILRDRDGALEWACSTCGQYNPLEASECVVCATPFAARWTREEPAPARSDWTTPLVWSALLPGAGHVVVGRPGTGFARALLFVIWFGGGLLVLAGPRSAPALAVGVPLLGGAALVWAASLYDLVALQRGGAEVLRGRALLWLVVAVTGLSVLGLMLSVFAGTAGGLPAHA